MTTEMFDVSPAATHSGSKIRKTVTRGLLVAAMTGGLAFGMAMPAFADTTATTFNLAPLGVLSLAVQPGAALTDATSGTLAITGQLGNVMVTDPRGGTVAWILTAGSSIFVSTPSNVASNSTGVTYATGTVTTTGVVTAPAFSAGSIAASVPVITSTNVNGNNTATFDPTIVVTLPASAVAGSYAGTVTTSVL